MPNQRNRAQSELRPVEITPNFLKHPEGSALIRAGDTTVICTATIENKVKDWLRGKNRGWVTAEYAMLPRANRNRGLREGQFGRWPAGRSQEIQRLIGRCLRAAVWQGRLGERTITIDCDVLQGDGGTRTASVTGGFVALAIALNKLWQDCQLKKPPFKCALAAVSAGIVNGNVLLDLDYAEDSNADVDLNIAGDSRGNLVEIQATAEGRYFSPAQLTEMTNVGLAGIAKLIEIQKNVLKSIDIDIDAMTDDNGETP